MYFVVVVVICDDCRGDGGSDGFGVMVVAVVLMMVFVVLVFMMVTMEIAMMVLVVYMILVDRHGARTPQWLQQALLLVAGGCSLGKVLLWTGCLG